MVKGRSIVPQRGHLYWADLGPVRGHEQDGRRPVLVISPTIYNERSGIALVCPLTSKQKGYTYEVRINTPQVSGAVLADQIRAVDWPERAFDHIAESPIDVMGDVQSKLRTLIL